MVKKYSIILLIILILSFLSFILFTKDSELKNPEQNGFNNEFEEIDLGNILLKITEDKILKK